MDLANWRDIALVFLILQAFILSLIPGAILYGLWWGMRKGNQWLRQVGFPQARQISDRVEEESRRYGAKVAAPLIALDEQVTRVTHTTAATATALRGRQRSSHV
ncbi:MAG: hypothetical protein HUU23_05940 [Caldilineales bacterium]|nr:hypothetical protein [Caldilineales bacterium]